MDFVELLKNLISRVDNLKFGNNNELDDIKKKSRMILENLFPAKLYSIQVDGIKFEEFRIGKVDPPVRYHDWLKGKNELHNLLDTALQDYLLNQSTKSVQTPIIKEKLVHVYDESKLNETIAEFSKYKKAVRNWVLYSLFLFVLSTVLWTMYFTSTWNWYNTHDKKLSITCMINLTIIVGLLNIPLRKKWLIWIPIVFGILIAILSII